MAVQISPDNPDNPGQVVDKTRTDKDTPLRGVRCPDCLRGNKTEKRGTRAAPRGKHVSSLFLFACDRA
jgi:hypothetical protein